MRRTWLRVAASEAQALDQKTVVTPAAAAYIPGIFRAVSRFVT